MYYVYVLYFNGIDDCYVGATKDMDERMVIHKKAVRYIKRQQKLYKFIRHNNLYDKMKMKILDTVETDKLAEAKLIERLYIDTIEPTLNSCLPGRTRKQYFNEHKNEIYRKRNIKNLLNREKFKEKSLKYYYDNREKRNEKHKQYLKTEKGKQATANRKRKVQCICGAVLNFNRLRSHTHTQKHKDNLMEKIIECKSKLKYSTKNIDIRI